MGPIVRRLIARIFGSDEVEQHYSVEPVSTGKAHWEHYYPHSESSAPTATPAETPAREKPQQSRQKPALQG